MKTSPVQLLRLAFRQVKVALDTRHLTPDAELPTDTTSLDGVTIHTTVRTDGPSPHENGQLFLIELQVLIDNQPAADNDSHQKFAPYTVDIVAGGQILVPRGAENLAPVEDLAVVNGAGLLWSAVREQVLALTCRMPAGSMMLPTVHFHDLKRSPASAPASAAKPKAVASRKRASARGTTGG